MVFISTAGGLGSSAPVDDSCRCCRRTLLVLLRVYNEALLLFVLAGVLAYYTASSEDGACLVSSIPTYAYAPAEGGTQAGGASAAAAVSAVTTGIAMDLPPVALLAAGVAFTATGIVMLACAVPAQRIIVGLVVVGGLAFVSEQASEQALLGEATPNVDAALTLMRDGLSVGGFTLDLRCTGSMFAILVASRLGLWMLETRLTQRAMMFVEGAACGVLAVRLAADFYAPLLVSSASVPDAGLLLGYPIVPFWASAVPLGVVLGTAASAEGPGEGGTATLLTLFLGAFCAAKGLRTLQDYYVGGSTLELAGGASVDSDMLEGGVQLGLLLLGAWRHRQRWARPQCCGGGGGGCCPALCCCADDEEDDVEARASAAGGAAAAGAAATSAAASAGRQRSPIVASVARGPGHKKMNAML